jgi:hypothetical protein
VATASSSTLGSTINYLLWYSSRGLWIACALVLLANLRHKKGPCVLQETEIFERMVVPACTPKTETPSALLASITTCYCALVGWPTYCRQVQQWMKTQEAAGLSLLCTFLRTAVHRCRGVHEYTPQGRQGLCLLCMLLRTAVSTGCLVGIGHSQELVDFCFLGMPLISGSLSHNLRVTPKTLK